MSAPYKPSCTVQKDIRGTLGNECDITPVLGVQLVCGNYFGFRRQRDFVYTLKTGFVACGNTDLIFSYQKRRFGRITLYLHGINLF